MTDKKEKSDRAEKAHFEEVERSDKQLLQYPEQLFAGLDREHGHNIVSKKLRI